MAEKECPSILEEASNLQNKPGVVVAWIGRLGSELSTGFCKDRICSECPVGKARRGMADIELGPREMVVSVVSGALQARINEESVLDHS